MTMTEAAVNEYRFSSARENDIGLSRKVFTV